MMFFLICSVFFVGCVSVSNTSLFSANNVSDVDVPTFTVANWNLEVFGQTKASKDDLLMRLADNIDDYDVVFVQEIRDKEQTAFSKLCSLLEGYDCFTSNRAGRSRMKEQYGVIHKPSIQPIVVFDYSLDEASYNYFERPPLLVVFNASGYLLSVFNIHVKPSDAWEELTYLELLAKQMEGNVMVLGDLNADCSYYHEEQESQFDDWLWVIPSDADTTSSSTDCAYDRVIVNPDAEEELVEWGIDKDTSRTESNHYLVWARMQEREKEYWFRPLHLISHKLLSSTLRIFL